MDMRDILKFRLWDEKLNLYVTLPQLIPIDKNGHFLLGGIVEMFTGYLDENNMEIYEGDILRTPYGEGDVCREDELGFYIDTSDYEQLSLAEMTENGTVCVDASISGNVHEPILPMEPDEKTICYKGNNYPITVSHNKKEVTFDGYQVDITNLGEEEIVATLDEYSMLNEY